MNPSCCTDALGEWLQRLAPMVRAICAERLDCQQCDDLQQEAFLRVLKTRDRVRDPEALPGYLGTITRNLCTDRLRRKHARPRVHATDHEFLDTLADSRSTGDDQLQRLSELQQQIDALPDSLRWVLELFYFGKLDYEAIAQRTGLTVGAVGQRLSRARRHLRLAMSA